MSFQKKSVHSSQSSPRLYHCTHNQFAARVIYLARGLSKNLAIVGISLAGYSRLEKDVKNDASVSPITAKEASPSSRKPRQYCLYLSLFFFFDNFRAIGGIFFLPKVRVKVTQFSLSSLVKLCRKVQRLNLSNIPSKTGLQT